MKIEPKEFYLKDNRVVLTLDAGGTNLVFSAIKGGVEIIEPITLPCTPNDLNALLKQLEKGFQNVIDVVDGDIYAISFAFPGPSNYKMGIIGDLPNFPAFRGGVALGPFLEEKFKLPVFINNDTNLYGLGEYVFGFLPEVNQLIKEKGGSKNYNNLIGITLGTGFGSGIICDGHLNLGDNSNSGEIWLMRNSVFSDLCCDASVGNHKIRALFAANTGIEMDSVPNSEGIYKIAKGEVEGDIESAKKAFSTMGTVLGDALANASILIDGLIVIGGGLTGAAEFIMPSLMEELNSEIGHLNGQRFPRMALPAFYIDEEDSLNEFVKGEEKTIPIPNTNKTITYDSMPRIGVGISKLGASKATNLGAYIFAVSN